MQVDTVAMLRRRFNLCSLYVCSELFHMGFCCSKEICFTVLHVFLTAVLFGHENNDLIIVFKLTDLRIKSKNKDHQTKVAQFSFLFCLSSHTFRCFTLLNLSLAEVLAFRFGAQTHQVNVPWCPIPAGTTAAASK